MEENDGNCPEFPEWKTNLNSTARPAVFRSRTFIPKITKDKEGLTKCSDLLFLLQTIDYSIHDAYILTGEIFK